MMIALLKRANFFRKEKSYHAKNNEDRRRCRDGGNVRRGCIQYHSHTASQTGLERGVLWSSVVPSWLCLPGEVKTQARGRL
jgi:hypothetical protein